jgi:CobQ-like glutamine amidotransferase family enzyme
MYETECKRIIDGEKILDTYRAKELMRLIGEVGIIEDLPYELMIQTLSHIEVGVDRQLKVSFLCGTEYLVTTP